MIGLAAPLFVVQFFFMKFGTDVLLLPPIAVGLIFFVGRVWDAVSDPIVGALSDRTRTRIGRRRPWMFGALLPLACAAIAVSTSLTVIFVCPDSQSRTRITSDLLSSMPTP